MIKLWDIEQGSDEWLELKAPLYTGTCAEKLLGYSGSVKIIDGVVSAYALNEITGFGGNFYTKRGHLLEDEAIELYQQITGEVGIRLEGGRRVGFVTNTEFPSSGYSPDDIYPDRTIECKAFEPVKHMKMYRGDIPLKVLAQCYFGMLICGVRLCHLLIYNPDMYDENKPFDEKTNNPTHCFKIIEIKWRRNIDNNFKRILRGIK